MVARLSGLLLALVLPLAAGAESDDELIGKRIADFQLQDYLGSPHRLADWSQKKAVAVVFFGVECPLAKLYGPRLDELAKAYEARGVAFIGINANQQDSLAEIAHYARIHRMEFTLLKDPGNAVADEFGAQEDSGGLSAGSRASGSLSRPDRRPVRRRLCASEAQTAGFKGGNRRAAGW